MLEFDRVVIECHEQIIYDALHNIPQVKQTTIAKYKGKYLFRRRISYN